MTQEASLRSRLVHQGKVIGLRIDTVRLPNGRQVEREIVVHPGAIVAVPIDSHNNVLMVRQYRKAADEWLLELPAGTLEPGESPDDAVQRELAEEIGHRANGLVKLGAFFAAPGYSTELLHCYLARDLIPAPGEPEDDESMELVPTSLEDIRRLIDEGALRDSKTLAGLTLAMPHIGSQSSARGEN